MHEKHPEIANKFRGSDLDPFYNDEMTDAFVRACFEDAE